MTVSDPRRDEPARDWQRSTDGALLLILLITIAEAVLILLRQHPPNIILHGGC